MGPILSIRPVVQTLGTSPHQSAGQNLLGGSAALNGARAEPAAKPEAARPVVATVGTAVADDPAEESYRIEAARARAEAAQRAYTMASLAAGLNPLKNPLP